MAIIDFDEKLLEEERQQKIKEWDNLVYEKDKEILEEYKSLNPDENVSFLDRGKENWYRIQKAIDTGPFSPAPGRRETIELLDDRGNKIKTIKMTEEDKGLSYSQLADLARKQEQAYVKFRDFYNKKHAERFSQLPEIMKEVELTFGGVNKVYSGYKSSQEIWDTPELKVFAESFFNNLSMGILDDAIDPIYDDYLKKRYSKSNFAGSALGSLTTIYATSGIASSLKVPQLINSALSASKIGRGILTASGSFHYFGSRFTKIPAITSALTAIAKKRGLSWLAPKIAPAITKTGFKSGAQSLGAGALTQFGLGAVTDMIRESSRMFREDDNLSSKEYFKKMAERGTLGGIRRWGIGVINSPSSWGARMVGDALYSGIDQMFNISIGRQKEFDQDMFWKDFVLGHLMGEVQGWFLGGGKTQMEVNKQVEAVVNKIVTEKYGTEPSAQKDFEKNVLQFAGEELNTKLIQTKRKELDSDALESLLRNIEVPYDYYKLLNYDTNIKNVEFNDLAKNEAYRKQGNMISQVKQQFGLSANQAEFFVKSNYLNNIEEAYKYLLDTKGKVSSVEKEKIEKIEVETKIEEIKEEHLYDIFDYAFGKGLEKSLSEYEKEAINKYYSSPSKLTKIQDDYDITAGTEKVDEAWVREIKNIVDKNPNIVKELNAISNYLKYRFNASQVDAEDVTQKSFMNFLRANENTKEKILSEPENKRASAVLNEIKSYLKNSLITDYSHINFISKTKEIDKVTGKEERKIVKRFVKSLDQEIQQKEGETKLANIIPDERSYVPHTERAKLASFFVDIYRRNPKKLPAIYATWLTKINGITNAGVADLFNSTGISTKQIKEWSEVSIRDLKNRFKATWNREMAKYDSASTIKKVVEQTKKYIESTVEPKYSKEDIQKIIGSFSEEAKPHINKLTNFKKKFSPLDYAFAEKTGGLVIDTKALVNSISERFGKDVADSVFGRMAEITKEYLDKTSNINKSNITTPENDYKIFITQDGLNRNEFKDFQDFLFNEFNNDFVNSKFSVVIKEKNSAKKILARFKDMNFYTFGSDYMDSVKDSVDFIDDIARSVRNYVSVVYPDKYKYFKNLKVNIDDGLDGFRKIKRILGKTRFNTQDEVREFIINPKKAKTMSRINDNLNGLLMDNDIIDRDVSLWVDTIIEEKVSDTGKREYEEKYVIPSSDGIDSDRSIIKQIADNALKDIIFSDIVTGQKVVDRELADGKGLTGELFSRVKEVGFLKKLANTTFGKDMEKVRQSAWDWWNNYISTTGGLEKWDPAFRQTMKTINAIRDAGEDYGSFNAINAVKLALPRTEKNIIYDMPKGARELFVKWGNKLLEKDHQILRENKNIKLTDKINWEDNKAELEALQKIKGFSLHNLKSQEATQFLTEMRRLAKVDEPVGAKLLVQMKQLTSETESPATQEQIFNTLERLEEKLVKPIRETVGDFGSNVLLDKLKTKTNNKFQSIISKAIEKDGIIKKVPDLAEITKKEANKIVPVLPKSVQDLTKELIRIYYNKLDPSRWKYIHHTIIGQNKGENQNIFYKNYSTYLSSSKKFRGKETLESTFDDFVGRQFADLDTATENGYLVHENILIDLAGQFKYAISRETNNRSYQLMSNSFMNGLLRAKRDGTIKEYLQTVGGTVFIPSDTMISAIKKSINTDKESLGLIDKKSDEAKVLKRNIKENTALLKRYKVVQDIMLKEENIKALTEDKDNFVPLNPAEYKQSRAGSTKLKKDGTYKNKGGIKDKYSALNDHIDLRVDDKTIVSSKGWEGMFVSKQIYSTMKNLIFKDDYMRYNSSVEAKNILLRYYDRGVTKLRRLSFHKPFVIGMNNFAEMLILDPRSILNMKWANDVIKNGYDYVAQPEKLEDIPFAELDYDSQLLRLSNKYNVYNTASERQQLVDDFTKMSAEIIDEYKFIGTEIKDLVETEGWFKKGGKLYDKFTGSAWYIDKVQRLAAFKAVFESNIAVIAKNPEKPTPAEMDEAGYITAERINFFMGNYDRMSMKNKQMINRVFHTGGFKILMAKMLKGTVEESILGMAKALNKEYFMGHKIDDYIFARKGSKGSQIASYVKPLLNMAISTMMIKGFLRYFLGFSDNDKKDLILGYRMKRIKDEDDPLKRAVEFVSLSTPLFEWEKWVSRPFRVSLKQNMARMPHVMMTIMSGRHPFTGQYLYEDSWEKTPKRNAAKLAGALFEGYIPFGSDMASMRKEDISLGAKLINFSGLGYYYNFKSPKTLLNLYMKAVADPKLSPEEKRRAGIEFTRAYKQAHQNLFKDNGGESMVEQLRLEYEKIMRGEKE